MKYIVKFEGYVVLDAPTKENATEQGNAALQIVKKMIDMRRVEHGIKITDIGEA